mmetsp:Transcript_33568/g.73984  ORF Transcript_33568/g.73984 Transcript_33568/m.73984 type:complete len:251 (-) Transcript_33568:1448-2200(-)
MPRLTTSRPTYRSTLPGAPPTYPKSASAISPGPLTMHPMMATATPGRCPVFCFICSVTSCRSKRVLPQLGQDTKSVFVDRIRAPCSNPKEVLRVVSRPKPGSESITPSPRPSTNRAPTSEPMRRIASSLVISPLLPLSLTKSLCPLERAAPHPIAWITGKLEPISESIWKQRREPCTRETPSGTDRISMATLVPMFPSPCERALNCAYIEASSMPVTCTANLMAISGSGGLPFISTYSAIDNTATAWGKG